MTGGRKGEKGGGGRWAGEESEGKGGTCKKVKKKHETRRKEWEKI